MRRILVDNTRRRNLQKHGADRQRITIQLEEVPVVASDSLLEALDKELQQFQKVDDTVCQLGKLRHPAGLCLGDAGLALEQPIGWGLTSRHRC